MAIFSDRTIASSSGLSSRKYRNQTATSDFGHFCAEVPKSLHIDAYPCVLLIAAVCRAAAKLLQAAIFAARGFRRSAYCHAEGRGVRIPSAASCCVPRHCLRCLETQPVSPMWWNRTPPAVSKRIPPASGPLGVREFLALGGRQGSPGLGDRPGDRQSDCGAPRRLGTRLPLDGDDLAAARETEPRLSGAARATVFGSLSSAMTGGSRCEVVVAIAAAAVIAAVGWRAWWLAPGATLAILRGSVRRGITAVVCRRERKVCMASQRLALTLLRPLPCRRLRCRDAA